MSKDVLKNTFKEFCIKTNYSYLPKISQDFILVIFENFSFSFQQLKQIIDFELDFLMWNEKTLNDIFNPKLYKNKKQAFEFIRNIWQKYKKMPNDYKSFELIKYKNNKKISFEKSPKETLALGFCPVASENTRCCNLLTLDSFESCAFDCSYCSIQSFYTEGKIGYDEDFKEKLKKIKLDSNKTYHIGTGQSSDSMLWGNQFSHLEALFDFARNNPNLILEFKTKSKNIKYFLDNPVPKNIICTWSLNTPTIIKNEEHLTASLEQRLQSAKALSDKGILVGFHFHPMIVYKDYLQDYSRVFSTIQELFSPNQVAMVSFGTLTFIKPVISKLRQRQMKSKILEFEFFEINKKSSYSLELKKQMFKHAYKSFKSWHDKVYFYLCMEDKSLWNEVFGFEYKSNDEMERAMKKAYFSKISKLL